MNIRSLVVAILLLAAFASDSWGRSQQPPQMQRIEFEQQADAGGKIKSDGGGYAQSTDQSPVDIPEAKTPEKNDYGTKQSPESAEGGIESYVLHGYRFKISDLAIIFFTGLLALFSGWQCFELNRTVRSVIRQERPFLRPTDITSFILAGSDFEANKAALISYRLENYGRTPAILTEFRCDVVIRTKLPNPMKTLGIKIFHQEVIGPNKKSREVYGFSPVDIGDDDIATVFRETARLYCMGFVRYRDVYDRKRITVFCWQFDYATDSFFPVASKRHNYTK